MSVVSEESPAPSIQDDLLSFHDDVLVNGAEAALPHNLTDGWLRRLIRSIEERETPALAIMAVLAILGAKPELRSGRSISKSELAIYIERYYADLVCEEDYRFSGALPRVLAFGTSLVGKANERRVQDMDKQPRFKGNS